MRLFVSHCLSFPHNNIIIMVSCSLTTWYEDVGRLAGMVYLSATVIHSGGGRVLLSQEIGLCRHRPGPVLEILKIIVTYQVDTIGDGSITTQSEKVGLSAFDLMRQGICEQ